MDARVEKVLNLPAYQRVLLVVVLMVAIATGFYFTIYKDQVEEYAQLDKKKEAAVELLQKNQRIAAKLDVYKREYAKLEEELQQALGELPLEKEIPTLLTNIGELAKSEGLNVLRFQPKGETPKDFYAEVPVELKLSGSYHQAALFFDAVSKMERIVNIKNLKLDNAKSDGGRTNLSIDCQAITFRFLEQQQQSKKQTSKKRRK